MSYTGVFSKFRSPDEAELSPGLFSLHLSIFQRTGVMLASRFALTVLDYKGNGNIDVVFS